MSAAIDYSSLTLETARARGEPQFFDTSVANWKARLQAWFEETAGRTVYPDQTEMFLIEMAAYAFSLLGEEAQAAALQNLLVWASGRHIDDVAQNVAIERLDGETDERLVFRGLHAFDRVDRRGGWAGYGQFVFDVDADITDVAVFRRAPCVIEIVALTGRETAGSDLNMAIGAALHPETVRPQGDDLKICTATAVVFDITIRCRTNRDFDRVRAEVEAMARSAFNAFKRPAVQPRNAIQFTPLTGILGAQVSSSPLHAAAVAVEGVVDADVSGISYADLAWYEYPRLGSLTVLPVGAPDA